MTVTVGEEKTPLEKLIISCAYEFDALGVMRCMDLEGTLNREHVAWWLARTSKMIFDHPEFAGRIRSAGLSFKKFDQLVRQQLARSFDQHGLGSKHKIIFPGSED